MIAILERHAPEMISRGPGVASKNWREFNAGVSPAKRREIIRLRAKGYTNREIAKAADCDLSTVVNVLCGFSKPD